MVTVCGWLLIIILVVMLFPPEIANCGNTFFAASVLQCLLSQKQLNKLLTSVLSNHQSSDCKPWEYRVVFLQEHLFVLKKYCTSMLWFIYLFIFLFVYSLFSCLFIYLFIYFYLFVYLFLFIYLLSYLFIHLFIYFYLFIHLFILVMIYYLFIYFT